jgi:ATP-binding cassette subfamily F protein uup
MPLVTLREVSHGFAGPLLLDQANLQLDRGERVCLLGRNGTGKSTLMRLIQGELEPDRGEISRTQGLRTAWLTQEVPQGLSGTIHQVVAAGAKPPPGEAPWQTEQRVRQVLSRMNLEAAADCAALSAGMKRRVLLAQCLAGDPDILLLDEPTNHLDLEAICWLEDFFLRSSGTLLFVTHDRMFLRKLATRIVELDRGRLTSWSCGYDTYVERKEAALETEARQQALFDKRLAQEEVWIRTGIQARRTRNEGRVRALEDLRRQRQQRREVAGDVRMEIQEAQRTGRLVIEAKAVSFSYAERSILQGLSTLIMRGDRVGIIGPNGSGKTTLLRVLLGQLPPQQGTIRHGTHLQVAYFDQLHAQLDDEKTVQENVSDADTITIQGKKKHILGYLSDFLFTPEQARSPVKYLSGGERNRLLLARLFTRPANVLVMDEPTNDLDLETLELLEQVLLDYAGTLLLVSHDRDFLNQVVTSTLVLEGEGRVQEYAGGYDDWLNQRKPAAAVKAVEVATKAERPRPSRPRRLNYQEQRELQALPERIEALEGQLEQLHQVMADAAFYRQPGEEIARAMSELERFRVELADAYARWEALESQSTN